MAFKALFITVYAHRLHRVMWTVNSTQIALYNVLVQKVNLNKSTNKGAGWLFIPNVNELTKSISTAL